MARDVEQFLQGLCEQRATSEDRYSRMNDTYSQNLGAQRYVGADTRNCRAAPKRGVTRHVHHSTELLLEAVHVDRITKKKGRSGYALCAEEPRTRTYTSVTVSAVCSSFV